jgi:prolyl oligopeptidase
MRGARLLVGLLFTFTFCAFAYAGQKQSLANGSARMADASAASVSNLPKVHQQPLEESLHGVTVHDPYRWLEDSNSPETQQYVRDELAYTRSLLDPLPGRTQIHARLQQLLSIGRVGTPQIGERGGADKNFYFYERRDGNRNQPVLYVREGLNGKDRSLVDVNTMSADGTTALDWWHASHDGKYVCFGTSQNGSEVSTLQLIESGTGKLLPEKIARTRAASIAWKGDNSGFFYTRYPRSGEVKPEDEVYYRKVFYHQLGDAADGSADKLIFSFDKDPQAWPNVRLSDDDHWLLIDVEEGWSKTNLFLKDLSNDSAPFEITTGKEFLYSGLIYKGSLYVRTNEDASRFRVLKASADNPSRANWQEILPQTPGVRDAVLQEIDIVDGKLIAASERDASSELRVFSLDGKPLARVKMPGIGDLLGVGGNHDSSDLFFDYQSFAQPTTNYRLDLSKLPQSPSKTPLEAAVWAKVDAPIDPSQYEVKQVFYPSKDGTKVPMFLVSRKGLQQNGKNPTLLTGYGGFNISSTPQFRSQMFIWLEHGGIYAVANMRGGAEYGEDWHRAGMLGNKQNVFDDFIGAGEYLINQKYTDKDHLAIQGGSNGGLLMGAAFTQRPDLFRAVICQVPLLDMLRYQNFQIAKLWIPEYGSAEKADQFKWLYAYSPYHNVKAGAEYPAILFMTADTDTRVDPMHAKKMAALMQAEAKNGASKEKPILLRIEPKAGHGAGKPISKQVEEFTDIFSFLFWQLGVKP